MRGRPKPTLNTTSAPSTLVPFVPHPPKQVTKLLVSRGQEVAQCSSGSTYASLLNQECGAKEARLMHDGALAAMQAGYLPPLRPSVVMTLKHPDFAQEACTREGCKYQSCCGNRLEWQAGHTKLQLVVMHHKNMWKSKQPIRVSVKGAGPVCVCGWGWWVRGEERRGYTAKG